MIQATHAQRNTKSTSPRNEAISHSVRARALCAPNLAAAEFCIVFASQPFVGAFHNSEVVFMAFSSGAPRFTRTGFCSGDPSACRQADTSEGRLVAECATSIKVSLDSFKCDLSLRKQLSPSTVEQIFHSGIADTEEQARLSFGVPQYIAKENGATFRTRQQRHMRFEFNEVGRPAIEQFKAIGTVFQ